MDDLLQQGITAYKAGKRDEARNFFVSIVEQSPDNERAWEWMYNVCNTDKGRIHCLQQILRINPKNRKANQLFKKFPVSKSASRSRKFSPKVVAFVGVIFVCLVGVCAVSLLFMDNSVIASNPTQEPPIPIEKAVEMTFSAADAQTVVSYSSTPLSTATLTSAITSQPTATVFIFEMQTQAQLVNTPLPVETNTPLPIYETNTPFILSSPIAPSSGSAVCACDGGLDCKDFSTHNQAQACFEYCKSLGRGDVHGLDGNDQDGLACESLP
jgi:hypothetical protein